MWSISHSKNNWASCGKNMYIGLHIRYSFLAHINETNLVHGFSNNTQKSNFMKILWVGAEMFHTDIHDFSQFLQTRQKHKFFLSMFAFVPSYKFIFGNVWVLLRFQTLKQSVIFVHHFDCIAYGPTQLPIKLPVKKQPGREAIHWTSLTATVNCIYLRFIS